MALSYRTRKRLSLLILLVGMPLYVVVAVTVVNAMGRPPFWLELLVYIGLGFLWIVPFRAVFRGVGQPDPAKPDASGKKTEGPDPSA
ncbi:MAG: DUF2842 domain-containing protein [Pseudorhodobacter sp.]|nr:DUF2842 domain-containing protein [Pseudorhodobacter sp.]